MTLRGRAGLRLPCPWCVPWGDQVGATGVSGGKGRITAAVRSASHTIGAAANSQSAAPAWSGCPPAQRRPRAASACQATQPGPHLHCSSIGHRGARRCGCCRGTRGGSRPIAACSAGRGAGVPGHVNPGLTGVRRPAAAPPQSWVGRVSGHLDPERARLGYRMPARQPPAKPGPTRKGDGKWATAPRRIRPF